MKYSITHRADAIEAIAAYSGYRIRLVATRQPGNATYAIRAWYRGSESLPESEIGVGDETPGPATPEQAFDLGYARAVEWIDRSDDIEAARWGDEPDPGTGHNG